MTQYGFFFDQSRCSGCQACAVACKNWIGLPPGPLKYLRIYEYEKGQFPNVRIHLQWIPCYHCEEPACVHECPSEAIYKEQRHGAVLIDGERCKSCRICYDACPYGSPVFESDDSGAKAQKCTMCIDRIEAGLHPICVLACPNRALDFGPLQCLVANYGNKRDLEDMPSSLTTKPAIVFKSHSAKRNLVVYDVEKALKLILDRGLPQVLTSPDDATAIPDRLIGRGKLEIKHPSADELLSRTRNDEG